MIDVAAQTLDGPALIQLQVIDAQHEMFVCTIKLSPSSNNSGIEFRNEEISSGELKESEKEEEIGYYTVKGILGAGQCGVVKKAVHRTTGVQVAIKTLSKEKFEEIGLKWNDKELELMRYLNHPNIVHLFDFISGENVSYLAVELVEGGELLTYCCESGPLSEEISRELFRDILGSVDYLHRKGIVHRDLKLENCLLDQNGKVRIIDFGLANYYLGGVLETSCGSADYAAPELFAAETYHGPPVDVWAIGVML